MNQHPNPNFFNVDLSSQGERVAFIRGAAAMYAWAHGMSAPTIAADRTGNERLVLDALSDALSLAAEGADAAAVDHVLSTVREAVGQAMRDAAGAGML